MRQESFPTTTRRVPNPPSPPQTAPRHPPYRLEAGIVGRLREERRALIEAAPTTLEQRDGRIWLVRHLPSVSD
jgi:hypothetical protein